MMYDIVFAIFLIRIQVVTLETTISLFTAAMIKRKARSYNAAAQTILNIRIVRATIGARADGRSARWRWTQLSCVIFANSVVTTHKHVLITSQVTNVSSGAMLCCLYRFGQLPQPHTQLGPAKPHSLAPARVVRGFGLMRSLT